MQLLIDLQHIQFSFNTGIVNFSFDLVKGLVKYSNWDIVLLVWDDQEDFIDKNLGIDLPKIVVPSYLKNVSRLRRGVCPSSVKKEIGKRGVDVILTVCFTISSYLYPKKYHQIGVIHDIQLLKIRLQERDWLCAMYMFSNMFVYYRLLENLVTISDFVRHDVKKICGRDSTVIYNSITRNTENEHEIETIKNTPYILDVNSFFKYKNTENLIRAFSRIKDKIPHILYLKGYKDDDVRHEELMRFIKSEGCEERIIMDITNRTTEEMNNLYNHADLFVSPSLMEGFGMTPIEAAMHKVPVIVSNIGTLVEVTDGLVPTFDPKSVESISDTMLKVLNDPPSDKERHHIADHLRKKYSLENQVRSYMSLIETVMNA